MAAVGDIMLGTDFPANLPVEERDFFRNVRPSFQRNDIRFGNLEGVLYDGEQNPDGKSSGKNRYLFRTPTALASHLRLAGFNVMSLANNHSRDFGRRGIDSTKNTLRQNGIQSSSKDGEVAEFFIDGQRIALIAADFYPGKRSIVEQAPTLSEIRELKTRFDIVIVSCHAGAEGIAAEHTINANERYLGENRGNSISFAHQAVAAGADLIFMHGPHVPRGLEMHGGRLIAYSLGNFITERGISVAGNAGLAPLLEVELERDGRFKNGYITSFKQVRGQLISPDANRRALKLMAKMSSEDFPATRPAFGLDGSIFVLPVSKIAP